VRKVRSSNGSSSNTASCSSISSLTCSFSHTS
jgi:hypothetical protein